MSRRTLVLLLTWLIGASSLFASRPLLTDDFYTVSQGGYELEFGYATTQNQNSVTNGLDLSLKRGITPQFDLGIEIPYTTSTPDGLDDIVLHAKYRLWVRNDNEGLTGRVDYKFDNGDVDRGLGSGYNNYCLMLIYSLMLNTTKMHFNLGHINNGGWANNYIVYSAATEYPLWGEKGDVVAECVANTTVTPNPVFIQLGARYLVVSSLKLDAGYSFGLNNNSIKNNLTAGLHYEF